MIIVSVIPVHNFLLQSNGTFDSPHLVTRGMPFHSLHLVRWLTIFEDRVYLGKGVKSFALAPDP